MTNFSPMNIPPQGGLGDNNKKWFKRWYIWVLPAIVIAGAISALLK